MISKLRSCSLTAALIVAASSPAFAVQFDFYKLKADGLGPSDLIPDGALGTDYLASYGDFVREVAVRGRVVAAIKPTVYAPAAGTVTLLVEAGDTVAKGQILARVQSPELASQLNQERATLQRLETELTRQAIEKKQRELTNQQTIDMAAVAIRAAERELRRAQTSWDGPGHVRKAAGLGERHGLGCHQ